MTTEAGQDAIEGLDKALSFQDSELTAMDTKRYSAWVDTLVEGLACLGRKRLEAEVEEKKPTMPSWHRRKLRAHARRLQRLEAWSRTWKESHIKKQIELGSGRSRCRKNFIYLAKVFRNEDWYLVSLYCAIELQAS